MDSLEQIYSVKNENVTQELLYKQEFGNQATPGNRLMVPTSQQWHTVITFCNLTRVTVTIGYLWIKENLDLLTRKRERFTDQTRMYVKTINQTLCTDATRRGWLAPSRRKQEGYKVNWQDQIEHAIFISFQASITFVNLLTSSKMGSIAIEPQCTKPSFPAEANSLEYAQSLDAKDHMRSFREKFVIPSKTNIKAKKLSKPGEILSSLPVR